jgi:ankyrin repeat protein
LQACADVHAQDQDGATPLHHAVSTGHKDIAELLLQNGAKVGAQDNDGETPLHYAVHHVDCVAFLLDQVLVTVSSG